MSLRKQIGAAVDRLQDILNLRLRWAYNATFRPNGEIPRHIEIALADLRDYCRAERSTFDLDPRVSDNFQGRRDVWLRLNRFLNLDDAEVHRLVEVERE